MPIPTYTQSYSNLVRTDMPETILIALVAALIGAALTRFWMRSRQPELPDPPSPDERGRLQDLIEATVGTTGETYFYALVREVSRFLQLDAVFIASKINDQPQAYQTLAQ